MLAAAPPNSSPARLERLLRDIGELADVIDPFDPDPSEREEPVAEDDEGGEVYRPSFGRKQP